MSLFWERAELPCGEGSKDEEVLCSLQNLKCGADKIIKI